MRMPNSPHVSVRIREFASVDPDYPLKHTSNNTKNDYLSIDLFTLQPFVTAAISYKKNRHLQPIVPHHATTSCHHTGAILGLY